MSQAVSILLEQTVPKPDEQLWWSSEKLPQVWLFILFHLETLL